MKFVVTGGAGFIGNNIVRQLLKQNHTPIVVDNLYRGKIERISSLDVEFHKVDIRNYDKLRDILKNSDGIFHEAALTDVQESFTKQQEYNDVNVKGTNYVYLSQSANSVEKYIELARDQNLSHLVIDNNEKRSLYFKDIFYHEENYPYLIKEFDSAKEGYSHYNVKVFKIDYKYFDSMLKDD